MPRLGLAVSYPFRHEELVRIAQEARHRGLDSFWLTEGLGKDAFAQLAALATQTEGITLGTAIVNIYSRSATLMAMATATLDDISRGRFILGLGTGHKPAMENRHHAPFGKPLQRMRDYIAIVRPALAGQPVTHSGRMHSVRNLQVHFPAPRRRVPIYMAVLGLRMARLAGEMADGVLLHLATRAHVARVRQAIAEGAKTAGRDPAEIDVACFLMCRAAPDQRQAERDLATAIAYYGAMHFYRELMRQEGFQQEADAFQEAWTRNDADGAARCVSERLKGELSVAAGAEDIKRKVAAFREAGVDLPILYPTTDLQGTTRSVLDTVEAASAA